MSNRPTATIEKVRVAGLAMSPKFEPGALIEVQRIPLEKIVEGECYMIHLNDQDIIRRIWLKQNGTSILHASAENPKFPDFDIPDHMVKGISVIRMISPN